MFELELAKTANFDKMSVRSRRKQRIRTPLRRGVTVDKCSRVEQSYIPPFVRIRRTARDLTKVFNWSCFANTYLVYTQQDLIYMLKRQKIESA